MYRERRVSVIMPVLNEAPALPRVFEAMPHWVDRVVVVDNGSTDASAEIATGFGAVVVREPRRGYGRACQAGLAGAGDCDVVVFLDGDCSDDASRMGALIDPIIDDTADLVIGSRILGRTRGWCEAGAMPVHQRVGNRITTFLIGRLSGFRFTDLGPFRCIRTASLRSLSMEDPDYGWTAEMQVKAVFLGLKVMEVPVAYRRRIGRSKISGSLSRSVVAGIKMNVRVLRECRRLRTGPRR